MNLNNHFFLSSARKFLSDTAISFTLILALFIIHIDSFMLLSVPEGFAWPISIVVIFLSYPFGLFVNACSHFMLTSLIEHKIEKILFNNKYLASSIKKDFPKESSYHFFKIEDFSDFKNVAKILGKMRFVFRKIDRDIDYIEGLYQYLRNICFIIIVFDIFFIITMIFNKIEFSLPDLYLFVIKSFKIIEISQNSYLFISVSIVALIVLLLLCSNLVFYYDSYNINMLYLAAESFFSGQQYVNSKEGVTEAESIAHQVIAAFALFSFPEAPKEAKIYLSVNK